MDLGWMPDRPTWQQNALCAQIDPEIMFPPKGGSTREAKSVCALCEVRTECLNWAIENQERFGVLGGMSERERRRETSRRKAAGKSSDVEVAA